MIIERLFSKDDGEALLLDGLLQRIGAVKHFLGVGRVRLFVVNAVLLVLAGFRSGARRRHKVALQFLLDVEAEFAQGLFACRLVQLVFGRALPRQCLHATLPGDVAPLPLLAEHLLEVQHIFLPYVE